MMILLPFITLILIFYFYWKRNLKRFGIVNLLILAYLVMGCASIILELAGKGKSVFPITFEPMAYLSICFFITFWGFMGFKDHKFTVMRIENIFLYRVVETFLLIGGLLAILFFLPFAYDALTGDITQNRLAQGVTVSKLKEYGIINSIFSLLANLFILNIVSSFINLIPKNGKRNIFKACLLLFSSLSYVVYIFAYVGRDGVVFWFMSFAFCYLLFKDFLIDNDVKKLKYVFTFSLAVLLIPFIIITIARFSGPADERFSYSIEGIGWNIVNYAGQQIKNFNDHFNIEFSPVYGRLEFPVFIGFIESVTSYDIPELDKAKFFAYFVDKGVLPWVFTTFIGTLMLDFGKISTLVFLCLMSLVTRKALERVSKTGVFEFSNMVILILLYQIVYWGVFYFKQSATNYYMLCIILLFILFKVSKVKNFSVLFFKYGKLAKPNNVKI